MHLGLMGRASNLAESGQVSHPGLQLKKALMALTKSGTKSPKPLFNSCPTTLPTTGWPIVKLERVSVLMALEALPKLKKTSPCNTLSELKVLQLAEVLPAQG